MNSTLFNNDPMAIMDYMDTYMNKNPPDCNIFSEDGYKLPVHKGSLILEDHLSVIISTNHGTYLHYV